MALGDFITTPHVVLFRSSVKHFLPFSLKVVRRGESGGDGEESDSR